MFDEIRDSKKNLVWMAPARSAEKVRCFFKTAEWRGLWVAFKGVLNPLSDLQYLKIDENDGILRFSF